MDNDPQHHIASAINSIWMAFDTLNLHKRSLSKEDQEDLRRFQRETDWLLNGPEVWVAKR